MVEYGPDRQRAVESIRFERLQHGKYKGVPLAVPASAFDKPQETIEYNHVALSTFADILSRNGGIEQNALELDNPRLPDDEREKLAQKEIKEILGWGWNAMNYPPTTQDVMVNGKRYEIDGSGLPFYVASAAVEIFTEADPSLALRFAISSTAQSIIYNSILNTHEDKANFQMEQYFMRLVRGEAMAAFALTEPNAGSDAKNLATTAVKDGNDYIINGSKIFITGIESADYFVLMAVTGEKGQKKRISAFVVDKDSDGIETKIMHNKQGLHGSSTGYIFLDDVRVPADNLLLSEGSGLHAALSGLTSGRVFIGAYAVGTAAGSFDTLKKYAAERPMFGTTLAGLQNTQFKMAEMKTIIEAARGMYLNAALAKEFGEPDIKDIAAMAKMFAAEVGVRVTHDAKQLMGGMGYIDESKMPMYHNAAEMCEVGEGSTETLKHLIAKSLIQ